ncbi:MAG: hypothetical protein CME68_00645 [Halobacteriovoraceae bacterium]|nr:hypothetical protein [Halobacteriovoraceae bacterium]
MGKGDHIILNHYEKLAKSFGEGPHCTMQDQVIRQKEIQFFTQEITRFCESKSKPSKILDVGCGNGYLLEVLEKSFPNYTLGGLEFSPHLFEIAKNRGLERAVVKQGDCREKEFWPHKVDLVITERVIINLLSWEEQSKAFQNIADLLHEGGLYLMSESFRTPWIQLNKGRKEMLMDEIPISPHNRYLSDKLSSVLDRMGLKEIEGIWPSNYLSTHFYLSRIFSGAVKPKGGVGKNTLFLEFFNEALPSGIGNFSPILFRVFKKVA